ncbi:Amiloride-sensitive cation channel 4-A [Fasciola hepatica]|uniref:Amiloride-sensitive cation channel 4-A n=1 Tax=Fasciola hepatica TaxID=6192 RepID=A0A4E0RIJ1_FASHE|nr:Amiloride-sensitive cation channel 4-A [Fasciola hepatica]
MVACNRSKRVNITTRRAILLVVCFSIAVLTTYRVHLWLSHYTRLASKMMISAYDEQQPDLPFPLVTVCNINPARGSELYNARSVNPVTRGLDYELFSDAYQGRLSENALESKLLTSVYRLMDQASHQLKDMLKSCTVDQKRCYAANFTKSILPPGACYTFNGMTTDFDEFQLTLDPQSFDYLIPNQGFVGFRVLLHTRGDPLWAMMPSAVYAGPTFHTMLRVVGLKKIYKQQCVTQRQWARCIHQCMQDMLHKRCQCHLSGK